MYEENYVPAIDDYFSQDMLYCIKVLQILYLTRYWAQSKDVKFFSHNCYPNIADQYVKLILSTRCNIIIVCI